MIVRINKNLLNEQINNLDIKKDELLNKLENIKSEIESIKEEQIWTGNLSDEVINQVDDIVIENKNNASLKLEKNVNFLKSVVSEYEKADTQVRINEIGV